MLHNLSDILSMSRDFISSRQGAGCWHAGKYLMPFSGLSLLLFRIIMTGPVPGFGNIEFSHLPLDHKSMGIIPSPTCWINRTLHMKIVHLFSHFKSYLLQMWRPYQRVIWKLSKKTRGPVSSLCVKEIVRFYIIILLTRRTARPMLTCNVIKLYLITTNLEFPQC